MAENSVITVDCEYVMYDLNEFELILGDSLWVYFLALQQQVRYC